MNDDIPSDDRLARLARGYHPPPPTPTDEMWSAIEMERGHARGRSGSRSRERHRLRASFRFRPIPALLVACAAFLTFVVLRSAIGTASEGTIREALARDDAVVAHLFAAMEGIERGNDGETREAPTPEPIPAVRLPWLGFVTCDGGVSPRAEGVYICVLDPEGALALAGVRPGHALVSLDGAPVSDPAELYRALRGHRPGDTVRVEVVEGDGRIRRVARVELGEPQAPSPLDMTWSPAIHASLGRRLAGMTGTGVGQAVDTLIVISREAPETRTVRDDEVRLLSTEVPLGVPSAARRGMVRTGRHLVVHTHDRIHILEPVEGSYTTFPPADGPGTNATLGSILTLSAESEDGFAIYTARATGNLVRFTIDEGEASEIGHHSIRRRHPFQNVMGSPPFLAHEGGFLGHLMSGVEVGRVTRHGVAWLDASSDSIRILHTWDGEVLTDLGGHFGPPELFGPTVRLAVGPGPRVASGDGLDYCIAIEDPTATAAGDPVLRVCREWTRAAVGEGVRNPDPALLSEVSATARSMIARQVANQRVGALMPSYDQLLATEGGGLWVRTVGPEMAEHHPSIVRDRPDLGPSHRSWDVFDAGGALVRTLRLPATFDPRVVTQDRVYGFVHTGPREVSVAEVML